MKLMRLTARLLPLAYTSCRLPLVIPEPEAAAAINFDFEPDLRPFQRAEEVNHEMARERFSRPLPAR